MIHETAIIESGAKIGEGVQIGAYAFVGGKAEIGEGCILDPYAVVKDYAKVGSRCRLHSFCVIGDLPQDTGFDGSPSYVELGEGGIYREGVTVHRGTMPESKTIVGKNVMFMANSHVAHNCTIGDGVILANGALCGGHVQVGEKAFLSGNVAVHQHAQVGRLAMIGGLGAVIHDIPPFVITRNCESDSVAGLNLVGLKRAGISPADRKTIKEIYQIIYRSGLNTTQALAKLRAEYAALPLGKEMIAFIEGAKRGIAGIASGTVSDS